MGNSNRLQDNRICVCKLLTRGRKKTNINERLVSGAPVYVLLEKPHWDHGTHNIAGWGPCLRLQPLLVVLIFNSRQLRTPDLFQYGVAQTLGRLLQTST